MLLQNLSANVTIRNDADFKAIIKTHHVKIKLPSREKIYKHQLNGRFKLLANFESKPIAIKFLKFLKTLLERFQTLA